jgi:HSP20 family protein
MARTTKSATKQETPVTPVEETTASELATTDDRNWMLDLFDWPTLLGRGWHMPTRWFDPEHFFGEHFLGERWEGGFPMRVEQFHDGDDLVIRAELPGIDPDEDVEIGIEGRQLTIDATREDRTETTDDEGRRSEFRYGRFHRSMTLPVGADTDAVTATYTDGILEVRIPVHREIDTAHKVAITRG